MNIKKDILFFVVEYQLISAVITMQLENHYLTHIQYNHDESDDSDIFRNRYILKSSPAILITKGKK